jgi:hypothetical protein
MEYVQIAADLQISPIAGGLNKKSPTTQIGDRASINLVFSTLIK